MRLHRFSYLLILLPALVLLASGCDNSKPVRVTGVVRSKGKPVPNLVVHFVPEQGRESAGTTDDNGAFKLRYERDVEGAVRGKHKVYVEYRPRDPKQESDIATGQAVIPADVKAILNKYGKQSSPLSYDVTSDGQEIKIDLD